MLIPGNIAVQLEESLQVRSRYVLQDVHICTFGPFGPSPHGRGTHAATLVYNTGQRFIPARAGNTSDRALIKCPPWSNPRCVSVRQTISGESRLIRLRISYVRQCAVAQLTFQLMIFMDAGDRPPDRVRFCTGSVVLVIGFLDAGPRTNRRTRRCLAQRRHSCLKNIIRS